MLLIKCPWCGARDQSEFSCHGEAHIARPENPAALDDAQWGDYVFFRSNPKGLHRERWMHAHGCRRWFNAARDTRSDRILATYKPFEAPPKIKDLKSPAEKP
ncbi:MAG: sarcosine oxidase subunit delta [Gammaproteobacteria bacterium]|nr:sarcosine oxidase subunit delta [Gammaproteobacteria bacterium]